MLRHRLKNIMFLGSALCALMLSGCYGDTKVEFQVIGTGFKGAKLKSLFIQCRSRGSSYRYSGDVEIRKRLIGRVRMVGTVYVPKDVPIYCSLSGDGLKHLPYIPIYNNSFSSRHFKVLADAKIQVRLHRKSIRYEDESYDHIVFKKIDHIGNKNIKIAHIKDRDIASR